MTIPAGEPRALAAIRRGRVLPILWLRDHGRAVEIAEALADAGVQALEITLGDPAAQQSIAAVVKAVGDRVPVGAGTVLDREEPRRLAALGVEFCVSPTPIPRWWRRRSPPAWCRCPAPTPPPRSPSPGPPARRR